MRDHIWNVVHGLKPAMLMVVVQIAFAGVNVLYKLAVNDGMSLRVVVAYRFIFATAFIAPLALILERKKRAKMTWKILFQGLACGLFGGALAQNLYLEALSLTSVTFASAMANLTPAITFILAVSFGMERLSVRTAAGKAKIVGTLTGIGGAMLLTFYKGEEINIWPFHANLLHQQHKGQVAPAHATSSGGNTILGALFALASCFSYALWLIIQTKMSENYPSHYSSTALMSLMGALTSTIIALFFEKDWSQWRLGWNVRFLTVAYSGIAVSGVMVVVISWCVHMRGPLYVSVFSPLMLIIVALVGSLMLNENLHLGSIIGAVLIVCGLYVVLWGKGKEMKKINQLVPSQSHPESNTLQVVIMSPLQDKSSLPNNNTIIHNNVEDAQDSSPHRQGDVPDIHHDQKQEDEEKEEKVVSQNVSET